MDLTMARTKPKLIHTSNMPTTEEILGIAKAASGEYELSDRECKLVRQRIYKLNKDNAAGWKWRTMREAPYLLVWRIH